MLDLQIAKGLTLLFVTHNIGLARKIADRMAVMLAGRLVEVGPSHRVLSHPIHPYTQLLLKRTSGDKKGIKGERKIEREAGCPFVYRCEQALTVCFKEYPPGAICQADLKKGGKMNSVKMDSELIQKTIDFHGHWCPGLAIGIRAAELALKEVGRASDEEIVAVVETDKCAVDAIQYLTGCTLGKGNLIHRDYGKNAFTFYRRRDNRAIRLVTRREIFERGGPVLVELNRKVQEEGVTPEEERKWSEIRDDLSKPVMEADLSALFEVKRPVHPIPKKARMVSSLICQSCGELAHLHF